jgi:hypothetical protein
VWLPLGVANGLVGRDEPDGGSTVWVTGRGGSVLRWPPGGG